MASLGKETSPSVTHHQEECKSLGEEEEGEGATAPEGTPVPVTPTELAELRAHLASVVAMGNSSSIKCSSYFIEPVEWMEATLMGQVEGKVRGVYYSVARTNSLFLSLFLLLCFLADLLSKVQRSSWFLQLGGGAVFLWSVGCAVLSGPQVKDRRNQNTHQTKATCLI